MKDREIIEEYIKSLKEELIMYKDSLSNNTLEYVNKLKKFYNSWEKDLLKLDFPQEKTNKLDKEKNDNRTEVDNDLYDMVDEYLAYIEYKNDYYSTGSIDKLNMSHTELSHFLTLLSDMFGEISEECKDNVDERAMIKSSIKTIYQMFS